MAQSKRANFLNIKISTPSTGFIEADVHKTNIPFRVRDNIRVVERRLSFGSLIQSMLLRSHAHPEPVTPVYFIKSGLSSELLSDNHRRDCGRILVRQISVSMIKLLRAGRKNCLVVEETQISEGEPITFVQALKPSIVLARIL
jgi:hypothetical protein